MKNANINTPDKASKILSINKTKRVGILIFIFGVALPLFTLLFEIVSGLCAAVSFDPIPSIWHMLILASVPIINACCFVALRRTNSCHSKILGQFNAFAIGVSLYYTILFLPIMPIGFLALALVGTGLIPLTPSISLIVSLILRKRLKLLASETSSPPIMHFWRGTILAIILLLVLNTPEILTFVGAKLAIRKTSCPQDIQFLRTYGNRNELLKFCFPSDKFFAPLEIINCSSRELGLEIPGTRKIKPKQGQWLYYRITGTPYNAVKPPDIRGLRGNSIGSMINGNDFDFGQGGDIVAARIRGLSLDKSQMEASINAYTAIAYIEWTMTFKNDSNVQREARSQLSLPPGSVVSRLTLWINGKECEAAYNERNQVKNAYKKVVRRQRDPVLATTSGKDSVMLQCFPVPPNGGIITTKVGITIPLTLESPTKALIRMPYFKERNFGVSAQSVHTLKMNHSAPKPSGDNTPQKYSEFLTTNNIISPYIIRITRAPSVTSAWTEDYNSQAGHIIIQEIIETKKSAPAHLVLVIDGSIRMDKYKKEIANFISSLPKNIGVAVIIASDEVITLCQLQNLTDESRQKTSNSLSKTIFAGGCDNEPALKRAFDIAIANPNTAVVWLHATQPIQFPNTQPLTNKSGSLNIFKLYDLQFGIGPNVIGRQLEELPCTEQVISFGNAKEDLQRLNRFLSENTAIYEHRRSRRLSETNTQAGKHASPHLARLWANEEICRLAATGETKDRTKAVLLAKTYQLVTPVSGAVVLETAEQYKESGLKPVDPDSVPTTATVPEPATWLLVITGGIILFLTRTRQRKHA